MGELTFGAPDLGYCVILHHKQHSRDNDGRQRSLGYVAKGGGQKGQGQQYQDAGKGAAQWRSHTARIVDRRAGKGTSYGHRGEEAAKQITKAQGNHFLRSVHNFALGWKSISIKCI